MTNRWLRATCWLTAFFLLGVTPVKAEWRRAESPHFVVYGTGSEERLRERILLLEDFDRLLRSITSVDAPPAPNKLHIYIVSGADDLQVVRRVGANVAGFYTATPDGIAAFVDGRAQRRDNQVLFHEYAHHFMMQYAAGAYPAWYIEGFAEYFMTVRFQPSTIDVGNYSPERGGMILTRSWLPMEVVLFGDVQSPNPMIMAQFYAQSWLIVHYFYSTPERQAALTRLLAGAQGADPKAAFETATGFTPEQFTDELRRYIQDRRIRYRQLARYAVEPPPVAVTTMPRSANDLMLYEAALRIGIAEEDQPAHLRRIRTVAARYAGDPFATRVLAQAEALHGDAAAADRLLDPLLAAAPDDAELMYLKGRRHLAAAEAKDVPEATARAEARAARQWFSRAHRADPNHFQTLYRYAQSMRGQDDYVSENTGNVLRLAHQLAPQVSLITLEAASLLLRRGEFDQAETLLEPLAADPHDAVMAQLAQLMIEQARAHLRVPPPPAAEPDNGQAEPGAENAEPPG